MRIRLAAPSRAGLRRRSRFVGTKPVTFGFPTTIAGDGRTILDQFGVPWYAIADTPSSAIAQLSNADQDTYLDDRQTKGIRAIWVELVEHKFADNAPNDINNTAPFTGTAFQSPPTEAYMARVDRFLRAAEIRGITVLLFPAYLGFVASGEGWETEITAATNGQMTTWGTTVGTRFSRQRNLIYVAGGDQNPNATLLARTDAMMTAIRAAAPQLTTTHQVRGSSGHDIWSAYTWRDINSLYVTTGGAIADQVETVYAQETKPDLVIEAYYENEHSTTHQQFRGQLWTPMCEHYAAALFGVDPIWYFGSSTGAAFPDSTAAPFDTWQHALASTGSLDATRAAAFIASYTGAQWQAMVPAVALVTTGEGTTTAKAGIGVDTVNGRAVAYFPSSRSITLDLSVFTPSSLLCRWFDPTNAAYTTIGTYPNTAGRNVTYPVSANSAGDADWVLVITPGSAVTTAPPPAVNRRHRLLRYGRM